MKPEHTPTTTVKLAISLLLVAVGDVFLRAHPDWHGFLGPLKAATASIASSLIAICGLPVAQEHFLLVHPSGFGMLIDYACTGVIPAAIVLVSVAVVPASLKHKLWGITWGFLLTVIVNFSRIVHLYYVGVTDLEHFQVMHKVLWNILAVVFTVGYMSFWLQYTFKPETR